MIRNYSKNRVKFNIVIPIRIWIIVVLIGESNWKVLTTFDVSFMKAKFEFRKQSFWELWNLIGIQNNVIYMTSLCPSGTRVYNLILGRALFFITGEMVWRLWGQGRPRRLRLCGPLAFHVAEIDEHIYVDNHGLLHWILLWT